MALSSSLLVFCAIIALALAATTPRPLAVHEKMASHSKNSSPNERDSKAFFFLMRIQPDNCTTLDSTFTSGTCMLESRCTDQGGTASGECASGLGRCCYFQSTCGERAAVNETTFTNPSSPSSDSTVSNCELTVALLSSNICQLRLDFDEFSLEQPNINGQCETDFMTVTGTANDAAVPTLCGVNTGKHLYVDLDPTGGNPKINIDTGMTTAGRNWRIRISQIACNSPYKAPEGCSQYHRDSAGVVESFNYVMPTTEQISNNTVNRHLANLKYGVCVASRTGYCSITWSMSDVNGPNPYAFMMSGLADEVEPTEIGTPAIALIGSDNCPTDYVLIPGGFYTNTENMVVQGDRFCSLGLPGAITSAVQPFVMYVVTNSADDPLNEADPEASNAGFSLEYRQNACSALTTN